MPKSAALGTLATIVIIGVLWCSSCAHATDGAQRVASAHDHTAARAIERFISARVMSLRGGDPQKILRLLKAVAREHPHIPSLQVMLAEQYLREHNWDRALEAIQRAQQIDPTYVPAVLLHTRLMVVQGELGRAIAGLEQLRQRIPPHEGVYTILARLYMEGQHYRRAVQVMQEYLRREPTSLAAYYYLGSLYGTHLNQPAQATAMFRRLIDLQPENIQARKALVQIYLSRDDIRGALQELLALEQHAVEDLSVQVRIGVLYYELKEYDHAIARIEAVLQRDPRANKVRYYLGVMYEESGRFPQAKAVYEQLPAGSSYYKDAMMRVAAYYADHEQLPEAIATLEAALRRSQKAPEFYEYLAYLYQQQQDAADTIRVLRRAIRQFPTQPRFHYALAMQYEHARDRHKAVRAMLNLLEHQPRNAVALNYVGYMYAEWGKKLGEAEAMLQTAVELAPNDGHIVDSLGWLYYRRGEYAKALDLLERADTLAPNEPAIVRHIAQTLMAMGRVKDAIPLLHRAAALAQKQSPPNDEELAEIRKVMMAVQGESV